MDRPNDQPSTGVLIRLRPMQPEDLPAVDAIERVSFAAPWDVRDFERELQLTVSRCKVAVMPNGRLAGYSVAWHLADGCHLLVLATHPDFRRQRIAGRLLDAVEEQARLAGLHQVYLEVRPSNTAARALYEKSGYCHVGRRPRYYSSGEDALLMTKQL